MNASGTLAAANHIISALSIPANGTYDYTGMIQLDNSATTGTVRALQGTSSAITVVISGNEIT